MASTLSSLAHTPPSSSASTCSALPISSVCRPAEKEWAVRGLGGEKRCASQGRRSKRDVSFKWLQVVPLIEG
ncbi:hypothetical protein E2562_031364 [Oryza meyeriana var. granulata]|uniref:Uncharacterized protein n=1 Tax=Oryza meyeriana var. granulata TaxID=110450 RepID=A0A6G1DPJ7_9ORYZ|nr:hypothetical protein E2562_031364 [Oryza meyeriana var. granulata]